MARKTFGHPYLDAIFVGYKPESKARRMTLELRPDEEEFVRQMRGRAIARGSTLRDWVVEAMREKAERDADK